MAYDWYLKAANAGNGMAMFALGRLCTTFRRNDEEVTNWYKMAIEKGISRAESNLQKYVYEKNQGYYSHSTDYSIISENPLEP